MNYMEFNTVEQGLSVPADQKTLIAEFGLSPMEASFLQVLLKQDWVGRDEFPEVRYPIKHVIYTLRKKLGRRVRVINDGRGRYSIPDAGKSFVSNTLKKAFSLGE